jgi:phospholipase/lecithinase/hemolysin
MYYIISRTLPEAAASADPSVSSSEVVRVQQVLDSANALTQGATAAVAALVYFKSGEFINYAYVFQRLLF